VCVLWLWILLHHGKQGMVCVFAGRLILYYTALNMSVTILVKVQKNGWLSAQHIVSVKGMAMRGACLVGEAGGITTARFKVAIGDRGTW
jgi:hypothetical protein